MQHEQQIIVPEPLTLQEKQEIAEERKRNTRLTRAIALLRRVRQAGVELDDPRIDYVAVQIDRRYWGEIEKLLLEE